MKSSVSPFSPIKLTLVVLVLAGLCWLVPNQARAQSSFIASNGFYDVPAGPFATSDVALTRLEAQIQSMKTQFEYMTPGSQDFKNLDAKYQFYTIVYEQLAAGKTVQESITIGLKFFATDASADLPKGKKEQYKQEILTLLKP